MNTHLKLSHAANEIIGLETTVTSHSNPWTVFCKCFHTLLLKLRFRSHPHKYQGSPRIQNAKYRSKRRICTAEWIIGLIFQLRWKGRVEKKSACYNTLCWKCITMILSSTVNGDMQLRHNTWNYVALCIAHVCTVYNVHSTPTLTWLL